MAKVFVHALDAKNQPLVAGLYEFEFLPRIDEHVFIYEGSKQYLLKVISVQHFNISKPDLSEAAHLKCELLEALDA